MAGAGDVIREGTLEWHQDTCCKLRYTQSCNDPQDVNGETWWAPPPECSNKDIVGKGPLFTVSYSAKPVTLRPVTVSMAMTG